MCKSFIGLFAKYFTEKFYLPLQKHLMIHVDDFGSTMTQWSKCFFLVVSEFASLDESSGTTTFSSLTVCFITRFHSDVINETGIPMKALFLYWP